MNNLENHPIMKLIEIDKNHIENYVLETEEGTKRFKEKFHLKAINERNEYINREIKQFTQYKDRLETEIEERIIILIIKPGVEGILVYCSFFMMSIKFSKGV